MPSLGFDFERFMGNTIFTVFFYSLIVYVVALLIRVLYVLYRKYVSPGLIQENYFLLITRIISEISYLAMFISGLVIIYRAFIFRRHILDTDD